MLCVFFKAVAGCWSLLCLYIKSPVMEGDSEEPEEEISDCGCCCWRFIGRQHKLPDCRCRCCGPGRNSLSNHLLPQGHMSRMRRCRICAESRSYSEGKCCKEGPASNCLCSLQWTWQTEPDRQVNALASHPSLLCNLNPRFLL